MQVRILTGGSIDRTVVRLNRINRRMQDTLPVMEEIASDMLRIEKIVFTSWGHRGGGSWKRLKPDTIRKKGTTEILFTGNAKPGYSKPGHNALFFSVTQRGAAHQILIVTKHNIEFGTTVKAADITQKTRPFLKFTPFDVSRWERMIVNHIVNI